MSILALFPFPLILGQCLVHEPLKDLIILFYDFCHQGRANIYAWAQVFTQSEVIIRVNYHFISKYYPFQPFKLTNVANVECLARHNGFGDLSIQFVNAMCSIRPYIGLKLEAIIPKTLWGARLSELPARTFLQFLYPSFG